MNKDRPGREPRKPKGWKKPGKRKKEEEQPVKNGAKVFFRAKSAWQEDSCMFCGDKATLEAVSRTATIRCCTKAGCKEKAESLAALPNSRH